MTNPRLLSLFVLFALVCTICHGHTSGGSKLPSRKPAPAHHYYGKKPDTCPSCKCSCEVKPVKEHKKECRWKTVLKQASGKGQSVYAIWKNGGSINEGDLIAEDIATEKPLRCASIIDNWNKNIIDKVKVEVYEKGVRGAFYLFDGIGSDMMSWFSQERLISSPYDDIKTFHDEFFSIEGDAGRDRRFFIGDYDGCPGDCGFLVILEPGTGGCDWAQVSPTPAFIYGKIGTCANFNNENDIGFGDRFVISVRLCDLDW